MFDLMIALSELALPIFIFATMLNVGMTQEPRRILQHWRDWPFLLKVLVANFIGAPLAMWLLVQIWPMPITLEAALLLFSLSAGAPMLIKLTAVSGHDLALGASTMMLLVLGSMVIVPLALPQLLPELSVDGGALAWMLMRQLLVPMVLGALLAYWAPRLNARLQPGVRRIGNVSLYVLLVATIIGYLPVMMPIIRSGALILAMIFILVAFGLGWLAGYGQDHLEDVGGLATAQRNTAASMLIASGGFTDPDVFVLITLVNTLGLVLLIVIAKGLKRDNAEIVLV